MRILFFSVIGFISVYAAVAPQNLIESDVKLLKLEAALPAEWQMSIMADTLIIENPSPVWVLESNFINVPQTDLTDDEKNQKRIVEHGKKTTAKFVFLLKSLKSISKTERQEANYLSKKFALFEISATGFDTPYRRIYPWNIEGEASRIYNMTLIQNLDVVKGPVFPEVDYTRP
ncbi:MAG: hypothetical protein JNJ99_02185 [Crocinitomicaceae bacterium]|nr:hypothetical protein [Crocinitomicaceae bacterium]